MSTPAQEQAGLVHDGSVLAQILTGQGKIETQLAVIMTRLEVSERDREATKADQEVRIRVLERDNAQQTGSRDLFARVFALAAAAAAVAAAVASYLHH